MLKRFLFEVTEERNLAAELSITLLRVFAGFAMAFGHGLSKFPPGEKLVSALAGMGFPAPALFAWAAASAEFLGGILLAVGLLTRPAATFMAVTMAVAAFFVHAQDPFSNKEMALLYLTIAVVFAFRGASRFSLDRFAR